MPLTPKVAEMRIKYASQHPTSSMTAEEVVAEALKHKVYVAWSGGRCSTVALHITLQLAPNIPVVFNNTGIEYPETVTYVRRIADEWRLNFHELHPDTTFWKIVEEYGFPQLRGKGPKGRERKPMCCELLKEAPTKKFSKDHKLDGFITGIRVEESRPRMFGIAQRGLFYQASRDHIWKFHPIALWRLDKLMTYAKTNNIELNPLYELKGIPRIGCMPCTGFTTWREQLKKTNPRFYKWLNREVKKSEGEPTLWEFWEGPDTCRQDPEE